MPQELGLHLREEEGTRREADKLRADTRRGHQQAAGNQVHQAEDSRDTLQEGELLLREDL